MPDAGTHVPMVVHHPSKIKSGFDYNELFEFNDILPRETVFIHYDPLKSVKNDPPFGRFGRNKEYKRYSDHRFYKLSQDAEEKNPIPETDLTEVERLLKEEFQAELDLAPPYHFKQSGEYRKKK